ncbi:MAG: hypothetical protein CEO22_38 [Candidatus Berkelbacteria bacterium Gr01-1014_85]|uniref:Cohesin domain-containing protein n=1 Tax=Candidatus Berkelbacteria bacterium Gr01-1014_85 TaxID=2017150 RepID=A0A554JE46_9BACT|nr:MAG: hypothetical protein CEO22_38 [Candidatus Berkelbacteria bacterium Gr01-1014_85]
MLRQFKLGLTLAGLAIVGALTFGVATKNSNGILNNSRSVVSADVPVGNAAIQVGSNKILTQVGQTISVPVTLELGQERAVGLDLFINYDPTYLTLVDADTAKEGIQIKTSSPFGLEVVNSVNPAIGQINYSSVMAAGSSPVSGTQVVATLEFKAELAGQTNILPKFKLGSTTDTNVANANGRDLLSRASGIAIVINQ